MTYTLILTDKNPVNNQIVKCKTGREAYILKKQAEYMGFKVEVKGEKPIGR